MIIPYWKNVITGCCRSRHVHYKVTKNQFATARSLNLEILSFHLRHVHLPPHSKKLKENILNRAVLSKARFKSA